MNQNPYKSPDTSKPPAGFKNPQDKWISVGLFVLGLITLASGIYRAWFMHRVSTMLLAGGVSMMVLGWLKYGLSPRASNLTFHDAKDRYRRSIVLSLSPVELELLSTSLNEVFSGANLDDSGFAARFGATPGEARALLARVSALSKNLPTP